MSDKDELATSLRAMKPQMTPSPQLVSQVMTSLTDDGVGQPAPDWRAEPVDAGTTSALGHVSTRAATNPRAAGAPTTPRRHRRPARNHRWAGMLSGGVMAAVLAVVMIGGGLPSLFQRATPATAPTSPTGHGSFGVPSGPGGTVVATPVNPQAYDEVFQVLSAMPAMGSYATVSGVGDSVLFSGSPAPMPYSDRFRDLSGSVVKSESSAFVGTNTQVANIDEGDFVKTDGQNIYVAHGRTVAVVSAAAGASRQLATIDISKVTSSDDLLTGPVADLMIDGSTLIVLAHGFSANLDGWGGNQGTWLSLQATSLKTILYDIADPAKPRLLSVLTQSGSLVDSRLSDGTLYLVSQYMVDAANADPNDPATIVPLVGGTPVAINDVYIRPLVDSPTYSLVTAIDVASRRMTGEQAVLGRADSVYMSQDNLYLACTQWIYDLNGAMRSEITIPGTAGAYQGATTDIVRIGLAKGKPSVAATATVAGNVINQFALDEFQGNLRVVTTWNDSTNSKWQQTPALWVLDSSLSAVASIPELAKDEGVQSVRFDGATAYVVTYRQVDPLFAIDLSDPAHPVIMSALKIPGFSTYLHLFGDGQLLGIGMDDGGRGLKISMFDVSNPYDVREVSMLSIDADYTDVSYDHHAAFVDVPNSLVGFPTTKWNYDDGSGKEQKPTMNWDYRLFSWTGHEFDPQMTINLLTAAESAPRQFNTDQAVRGVRVADSLYVITSGFLSVYSLDTYAPQTVVTYS